MSEASLKGISNVNKTSADESRPAVQFADSPSGSKPQHPKSSMLRSAIAKGLVDETSEGSDVSWLINHLTEIINQRHLFAPFKRQTPHRIFVNRALQLDKIRFFGFDMDYTLAEYISPEYEALQFDLSISRLITAMGYPAAIRENYRYDPSFAIRGLWFDKQYGNLLKVDQFGSILLGFHGLKPIRNSKILELYPNKFVLNEPGRIYILNTLFDYSTVYLLACVVDFFTTCGNYEIESTGVKNGDLFISYKSVYNDVRQAVDFVHNTGLLQRETLKDVAKYLIKDQRLPMMLERLRLHAKVFILTNSGYHYTNEVMKYLLEDAENAQRSWTTFFDVIVVDAGKPTFFEEGTLLRQVDLQTGALAIGRHTGPLRPGQIYSGGSCDTFSDLIGAKGRDVLYVGDHIFGDILKSKKKRGWRTYLVVPELHQELLVWTSKRDLFLRLQQLDILLADAYKYLDSSSTTLDTPQNSEITLIKKASRQISIEMDRAYGVLGSTFRSGSRQTFFANQVQRYADLYAVSSLNLLHYPFSYFFKAPAVLLPHEATVSHNAGYNPLAAVVDLPEAELEVIPNTNPKVKLFGRMSMKSLSAPNGGENYDNLGDKFQKETSIERKSEEDEESDDEDSGDSTTSPETTPEK